MKVRHIVALFGCVGLAGLASQEAQAISLPDNSSCSTTGSNGCFKITNTNTGAGKSIIGTANGSGAGVSGSSSSGVGVSGSSASGTAISGSASGGGSIAVGVYGVSAGNGGSGVSGNSTNTSYGVGVFGSRPNNNGYAIYGQGGGTAVVGEGTGSGLGVFGSSSVIGVSGTSSGTAGIASGVSGSINTSGSGQAIYGDAGGSFSAWAGNYNGDVQARGFYNSSDARLKKDIKDAPYGLAELLKLRPVTYKWKDGAEHPAQNGLIAQEVQKVFPSAVRDNGKSGMLAVDYIALLPVAIKAIQQQQAVIAQQEARIVELERRAAPLASSMLSTGLGASATLGVLPIGLLVARRRRNRKR